MTDATKVKSIITLAEEAGMSTGIVTTARVTHASPSVLYAHSAERNWEYSTRKAKDNATACKDIALQLVEYSVGNGIDVVFGGGRRAFYPSSVPDPEYPKQYGKRSDGRNLINEWLERNPGAVYLWNKTAFDSLDVDIVKPVMGLFQPSHMQYEVERDNDTAGEPSIEDMTEKAIKILSKNPKGFFLFVEGELTSKIDQTTTEHKKITAQSLRHGAPHRTAPHRTAPHRTAPHRTAPHRTAPHRTAPHRTAPHRTAPHRTAPHRTVPSFIYFYFMKGGRIDHGHHSGKAVKALTDTVAMAKAVTKANSILGDEETLMITTADHSHVFTMAGYPRRGNPIFGIVVDEENITERGEDGLPYTTLGYANGPGGLLYGNRTDLTGVDTADKDFRQQALVKKSSESHGGEDVGIYATGPGAYLFHGVVEQNYIFHVMDHALCITPSKQATCLKHTTRGGESPTKAPNPASAGVCVSNLLVMFLLFIISFSDQVIVF
ncbi:hypothetical protein QZH41_008787 [Actinostola sp. cb2023]|nr:hypothetical protein QZH41_008787 [Actinostola sp. cb2023]